MSLSECHTDGLVVQQLPGTRQVRVAAGQSRGFNKAGQLGPSLAIAICLTAHTAAKACLQVWACTNAYMVHTWCMHIYTCAHTPLQAHINKNPETRSCCTQTCAHVHARTHARTRARTRTCGAYTQTHRNVQVHAMCPSACTRTRLQRDMPVRRRMHARKCATCFTSLLICLNTPGRMHAHRLWPQSDQAYVHMHTHMHVHVYMHTGTCR